MIEGIFISADLPVVYELFWNIFEWDKLIPHVKSIHNITSDSIEQHIVMEVENGKKRYQIETVRKAKKNKEISFHQLDSKSIISKHDGKWLFYSKGKGTFVECHHDLELDCPKFFSNILSNYVWNKYIKKNSEKTLRTLKLESEFIGDRFSLVVPNSNYLEHKFDIDLPVNRAFDIISDPKLWVKMYSKTAKYVKILKQESELVEFLLVEMVGKKRLSSHILMRKDNEKKKLYYQHINPQYPIKDMIIHWFFIESEKGGCTFIIKREYRLQLPNLCCRLLSKLIENIICQHVQDYRSELIKSIDGVSNIDEK
ncbi:SRPBCC family protein [Streptococcus gallolyticus subsp. gallolyticus]|uniref:SRPBCC family protein n=1 Tax=Streptococcus gallolyticus TaxID=315405 RepID=UPI002284439A|nr:SRPBCC family protein [Streptococcus gallolyticus]MCY7172668.1 SRPBCC family protein [Streptococcus gallolyticus subsp. gallolyticus]